MKSFLRELIKFCSTTFSKDKFQLAFEHNEPLNRFVVSKSHISSATGSVKPAAFQPDKNNELSVYRTKNSSIKFIWLLADKYITRRRRDNKKVIARAEFSISLLQKHPMLILNPDGIPYKRHLNIENWPSDSSWKIIGVELANNSLTSYHPSYS